jgi:hypothetical protein
VEKITRTFNHTTIIIKDSKSSEVLKQEVISGKLDDKLRKQVAIKFIKETGNTNFFIDAVETEEVREMSLETFLANSTVPAPKKELSAEDAEKLRIRTEKAKQTREANKAKI